jgi:abhydrolase domain-containing protein 12
MSFLWHVFWLGVVPVGLLLGAYTVFLVILTIPAVQNQVVYLNRVTLTWFKDVSVPEQWGFLRNQVTPFTLQTPDGQTLHAWHVLPLGLYQQHESQLRQEPTGIVTDITERLSCQLLRDDPDSLLVLYFHGAAGTLASGWRPPSYRAMSAGSSRRIHTISIDYRGFGSSTGWPSEDGLLVDATTLVDLALKQLRIPPSRIVLFGQSLGTAVCIAVAHHMATMPEPILFAGMVLVAPFSSVEMLTATYRVAGTIPLLSPVAHFPPLLAYLNTFIIGKWASRDKLAAFVGHVEKLPVPAGRGYHVTIIHAQDDYDIPWSHSEDVFWHAAFAATAAGNVSHDIDRFDDTKAETGSRLRDDGGLVQWSGQKGSIRLEICKYGLHDRIMSYPVVSLAVLDAFKGQMKEIR